MQIRKNDSVMVIGGRREGKDGQSAARDAQERRCVHREVNMVKRHTKPRGPQQAGGIVEKEACDPASNIMLICDKCNAPVRVGQKTLGDGKKDPYLPAMQRSPWIDGTTMARLKDKI